MIRAVAFDVMDTVLRDPYRDALAAACSLPLRELFARRDPELYPAFERGELDEAAYWGHYAQLGIAVDPQAFHRVRRAGLRWLPGMRQLLDDLDGRVVRAAATNYPVWVEEVERDHLAGRFERVVASCHLGVRKPDAGFYAAMLDVLELPAEAVLFVDDRERNVAGAREVGIDGHRFTDAASLRTWLAERGIAVSPAA